MVILEGQCDYRNVGIVANKATHQGRRDIAIVFIKILYCEQNGHIINLEISLRPHGEDAVVFIP